MHRRDMDVKDVLNRLASTSPPSKLIKGLMEIPYDHVSEMNLTKRNLSSHAKSRKYSNRRNKERPPVNPEDKCAGHFFIEPQSLEVMKRLVMNKASSKEHLVNYCEQQSRFQYYYTMQNMSYAKRHSSKKPIGDRLPSICCQLCDEYFSSEQALKDHHATNTHFEINIMFERLLEVFNEWYEAKLDPGYVLSSSAVQAEVEGVIVKTGKGSSVSEDTDVCKQIKQDREKQRLLQRDIEFLHDRGEEIFSALDAVKLPLEQFILTCYDKVMEAHWPTPRTKFYCRCCNYEAFDSEDLLQRHKQTDDHEEHQSMFMEAWCVSCQIHSGNADGYETHLKTPRHKMMKKLLDNINKQAVAFWNKVNDMHLMATRNTLDPFHDRYMISPHMPYPGILSTPGYFQSHISFRSNNQMHFDGPPQKKANFSDRSTSNLKSRQYPKVKAKVYLPDGRRKLSKSKVDRDRERMTKFIQKRSAACKAAEAGAGESAEEKRDGEDDIPTVERFFQTNSDTCSESST